MQDVKRLWATCLGLWMFCYGAAAMMDMGCSDQVPTNETSDQPVAGAPTVSELALPVCYSHNARLQAMDSGSAIMFGTARECATWTNGSLSGANCYDGPAPYFGRAWFQLRWGQGVGNPISSQAAELWLPSGNLPSVHTYNLQCSCTSCTAHRLVP